MSLDKSSGAVVVKLKPLKNKGLFLASPTAPSSQSYAWGTQNKGATLALSASTALSPENTQPEYQMLAPRLPWNEPPWSDNNVQGQPQHHIIAFKARAWAQAKKKLLNNTYLPTTVPIELLSPEYLLSLGQYDIETRKPVAELSFPPMTEINIDLEDVYGPKKYEYLLKTWDRNAPFSDLMEIMGVHSPGWNNENGYLSWRKDVLHSMEQVGDYLPKDVKEMVLDTLAHMSKDQSTFNQQFSVLMNETAPISMKQVLEKARSSKEPLSVLMNETVPISLNQALEKARGFEKPHLMTFSRALAELGIYPTPAQIDNDELRALITDSRKDGE